MIESIYPYLILAGITIGAVLIYLSLRARSTSNVSLALTRLNEQLKFDTPAFLQNAWPLLSEGGLRGMAWRLDWFGVPLEQRHGELEGDIIRREIQVAEMRLSISFLPSKHGERRYFDETLIETFLLLLRTDMWIKLSATDATFLQLSKLTLFLQHDMKNVAQFIQLMTDQLNNVPAGQEQRVLNYLRSAAPLMRDRADRIVRTLTLGRPPAAPLRTMNLAAELEQLCALYRLEHAISGEASILTPENTLDSALDNILKNYSDIGLREGRAPLVSIVIRQLENTVEIVIAAPATKMTTGIERLFEPFWSSNPDGLGIGLYQARQMVKDCGGSLEAIHPQGEQLQFVVRVPSA